VVSAALTAGLGALLAAAAAVGVLLMVTGWVLV